MLYAAILFLQLAATTVFAQGPRIATAGVLSPSALITLQADNGLFLSRINYGGVGGINPIEAEKKTPEMPSQFKVIKLEELTYAFQADNGKYLSRIRRCGKDTIEAAKTTIDVYSRFKVHGVRPGVIAIQADNGKFLSRINRGTGYNAIEAVKTKLDIPSQFIYRHCSQDGWKNVQTIERSY